MFLGTVCRVDFRLQPELMGVFFPMELLLQSALIFKFLREKTIDYKMETFGSFLAIKTFQTMRNH